MHISAHNNEVLVIGRGNSSLWHSFSQVALYDDHRLIFSAASGAVIHRAFARDFDDGVRNNCELVDMIPIEWSTMYVVLAKTVPGVRDSSKGVGTDTQDYEGTQASIEPKLDAGANIVPVRARVCVIRRSEAGCAWDLVWASDVLSEEDTALALTRIPGHSSAMRVTQVITDLGVGGLPYCPSISLGISIGGIDEDVRAASWSKQLRFYQAGGIWMHVQN